MISRTTTRREELFPYFAKERPLQVAPGVNEFYISHLVSR